MSRVYRLSLLALIAAACGHDPAAPAASPVGVYRLVSVNGQPLPYSGPPSLGPFGPTRVIRSDVVLRDDETFGLGSEGVPRYFASGTFHVVDGALALSATIGAGPGAVWPTTGVIAGDSIVLVGPDPVDALRYVYRRVARPAVPIPAATYRLGAVNGRGEPLTLYDTVVGGDRYVSRIVFDSLEFDGWLFYRRRRSERAVMYLARGDSSVAEHMWMAWGSYEGDSRTLVLRLYASYGDDKARDSLTVVDGDLLRRTLFYPASLLEERYQRVR